MSPRVLAELGPSLDTDEWARRYARGQVPDRSPYGLHRLAGEGLAVQFRRYPTARPVALPSRALGKLTGGARWPESVLGRPSPSGADARFFWEERTAIPALLLRRTGLHDRPIVAGIIWNTESTARLSPAALRMSQTAFQRAEAVHVQSSGQVPVLREEWKVPGDRIHFVPLGVDTDFWHPDFMGRSESSRADFPPRVEGSGDTLVLSVGNDRHRDHGMLVTAMRKVHDKLPQARLAIVTTAPVSIPAEVGRWQRSATHPQLRELYRRAAVVAICTRPNLHASGLTATLESMAMGRVVVATRTAGLDDYIVSGETGLLVPTDDPDAMSRALVEMLADPDRCTAMGLAAQQRVRRCFSTQAMSARFADVIKAII